MGDGGGGRGAIIVEGVVGMTPVASATGNRRPSWLRKDGRPEAVCSVCCKRGRGSGKSASCSEVGGSATVMSSHSAGGDGCGRCDRSCWFDIGVAHEAGTSSARSRRSRSTRRQHG